MRKIRIVGMFAATLVLSVPSLVRADTITITGGLYGTEFSFSELDVRSSRFSLLMFGGDPRPTLVNFHEFLPLGNATDFSLRVTTDFDGSGTIDGVSYKTNAMTGLAPLVAHRNLTFQAFPVVVPTSDTYSVQTPFTLSGLLSVETSTGGIPLLVSQLIGSGILTARGSASQSGGTAHVSLGDLGFSFESAAPTPEPATFFMIGIGVAAVARRYALRR